MEQANNEMLALAMQADALDGDAAAAGPEAVMAQQQADEGEQQAQTNVGQVRMMLDLGIPILSRLYPSLADIYTPEACGMVAASLGPVLAKYNINLADWGSAYKEEIGALMVCGPIAWATVQGVKADIAARADKSPKAGVLRQPPPPAQSQYPEAVVLG